MKRPRSFDDYIAVWHHKGETWFRRNFTRHVLLGIGVVGELDERGARGDAATFLAAIHGKQADPGCLQKRIWLLKKSQFGPPGTHVWVGRGSDNDVVIPEHSISKEHCQFSHRDGTIYVLDNHSHNGTFVNERPVPPRRMVSIADQDELTLGRYRFEFLTSQTFVQRIRTSAKSSYYTGASL